MSPFAPKQSGGIDVCISQLNFSPTPCRRRGACLRSERMQVNSVETKNRAMWLSLAITAKHEDDRGRRRCRHKVATFFGDKPIVFEPLGSMTDGSAVRCRIDNNCSTTGRDGNPTTLKLRGFPPSLNGSKNTPHFFREPAPYRAVLKLSGRPKRGRQSRQRRALR